MFNYIRSQNVREVILIAWWESYEQTAGEGSDSGTLASSLLATVRRLAALGCRPSVMLQVPIQYFSVPKALANPVYSRAYVDSLCAKPAAQNELERQDPRIVAEIEAAGGRVLDPKPRFLDSAGGHYVIQSGGIALYRDWLHLTTRGARLMLLPLLREKLILEGR